MPALSIPLSTPDASGNAYEDLAPGAGHRRLTAHVMPDVAGSWSGLVLVPAGTAFALRLSIATGASAGNAVLSALTAPIADAESLAPGALTAEAAQTVTVPATANLRKDVRFPASGNLTPALAEGDLLLVRFFHDGASGSDTLAAPLRFEWAALLYTAA